ncbi:MAG TPA: hypothetical protein VJ739_11030, partial [Gemmataceae bacterium]|nr:hypothetical protein [Gemmataceae bacterium]
MAKRFDAALKHLLETYPGDWLAYLLNHLGGAPGGSVEVIDSDLSAVTAAADKILRVRDRRPWLLHLELQSSPDERLPQHMLLYNVLLHERHGLPVRSAVLLLRPAANRRNVTGLLRREWPGGQSYLDFRDTVLRLWEQPATSLLTGGVGLLPLAPLAHVEEGQLPDVVRRVGTRLEQEVERSEAENLWTATYLLLGLRYSSVFVRDLLRGVHAMEESTTFQAIIAEGEIRGVQKALLHIGGKRLGPPSEVQRTAVQGITSLDDLERMIERTVEVDNWEELLAAPRPRRRRRRS